MGLPHQLGGFVRVDHACEGWSVQEERQLSVLLDDVRLITAENWAAFYATSSGDNCV